MQASRWVQMTRICRRCYLTDAQRHRKSLFCEGGPRDLPQSDGNKSRRRRKLSLTIWKIRSLLSSETTHPALHQWILETLHQDKHRHQVWAVLTRVPRQAHTGGRTSYPDLDNYEHASQWGQDWNAGDADTSGSSDGELYGL